ncbi:MAG: apolipoprotein N-acyltransferase [Verrucomicrobiota bacterium]
MIGSFKELDRKRKQFDKERPSAGFTHPVLQSPALPVLGSILSGILLALGFPGFGKSTVVFAALVPLMFAVQSASVKKAAWLGLLCGFVFFMTSLSWLCNLFGMVEGVWLGLSALLGYAVLALYCALYFIPFAIAVSLGVRRWGASNGLRNIQLMFAFTMVWVGAEYLRGIVLTGFPWNPLGVSQYANTTIIQVAEWGGVSVVSAYIVWMNAGIFFTVRQYTHRESGTKYRPHFELMIGILPIALSLMSGMNLLLDLPKKTRPLNVALVQPNISQAEKWDAEKVQQIRNTLEELTETVARIEGIDLIIWPETALPDYVRVSPSSQALVGRMVELGFPLLAGAMDLSISDSGHTYYNSSILFGTNGAEIAKYDKQHLVPFGEYVPFPGLMKKFTPIEVDCGAGTESTLMPLEGKAPFSVLICFEDIVAPLAARAVRNGARWLVNQTNDAWFDPGPQSEQHLAQAVFRCIENRVPMARCCNTGVTCIIDAYGNVTRNLDPRTSGFTVNEIHPRPAGLEKTFYTRNGDAFAKASLLAAATVVFVLRFKGWGDGKSR